jgi:formate dehydrogenase subunit delta
MMSNREKLVYMANQIARNFEAIGHEAAAKATADHIASFWDPRMKALIFARMEEGGGDLSATAAEALRQLRDKGKNPTPQMRATEFDGEPG